MSARNKAIRPGLAIAFLAIALQWLAVIGFVAHSYTWFLKVHDPGITAGIAGTIVFSVGSIATVLFSVWASAVLREQCSRLSYFAQLLGLAGLAGLLVFFGLAAAGYVMFIQR